MQRDPNVGRHAVDLRSDTVTRPTEAMYNRMKTAALGDDGLDFDPTARELEEVAADALGKEAGLFVPSCTMANLLATLVHVQRQEQVVLEATAHMFTSERGAATFTGAFYSTIPGKLGAMDLGQLEAVLQHAGGVRLRTALVCMETTHNNAGGTVLSLPHMDAVHSLAALQGAAVHLDGARLFNAAVALGATPADVARYCDTVSLCLSKGLSAPVGAVLAGSRDAMGRARAFRRMLGGTQRQIGIMAAAGLEAIQVMGTRLVEDHARARQLSAELSGLHPLLHTNLPQTNIVQVDVSRIGIDSARWVSELQSAGLRVRPLGAGNLRCVTHRHIDDLAIGRAVTSFEAVLKRLSL